MGSVLDSCGDGFHRCLSCLAIFTHVWILSLLFWETLFLRRGAEGSMGCLGTPPMKHSFFESYELFLMMKGQLCDIITVLYILEGPVWLPWRRALIEKEEILHPEDLLFCAESPWAILEICERWCENNRIAPVRSVPRRATLCLLQHRKFIRQVCMSRCELSVFSFKKDKTQMGDRSCITLIRCNQVCI